MPRLRIVPIDDSESNAIMLEIAIRKRFGHDRALDKKSTSLWFINLEGYDWTQHDAEFMENLAHTMNAIAGWNYQDYV